MEIWESVLIQKIWTEQWRENTSNSQQLTGEKVFGKLDANDGF